MKEANKNIPQHWEMKKLGEVCEITSSRRIFQEEYVANGIPFYRTKEIKELSEGREISIELFISNKKYEEIKSKNDIPQIGDILLSAVGTIGISYIIKHNHPFYFKDGNLVWLKNLKGVSSHFLNYYLSHFIRFKQEIATSGSAYNALTIVKLKSFAFPLPPLPEQVAIVNKIEELFSELENGKQQLLTAQQQLKVYRQSLLKAAFEGRLTHDSLDLPDSHDTKSLTKTKSRKSLNQENQGTDNDLPEGWKWVKIEDVANASTGITPLRSNNAFWENGTIPWITSGALNNIFVHKAEQFITEKAFKETTLKLLPKHSLLVALYGEGKTRGKCSELLFESTTNQAIAGLILKKEFEETRQYLKWFLLKNYNDIRRLSSGGVQPNLNLSIIKNTIFPLPPLPVQQAIVEILESKLTVCDKLEETISESLRQTETLRQSILKKAFEGKLDLDLPDYHDTKSLTNTKSGQSSNQENQGTEFPKKIEGITEIELQAGIIAMVIDAHTKNPKYANKLNHVKCEKISDLVERKLGISLGRHAVKDAAGPDDYSHLKKVEHRATMAGYFQVVPQPIGHAYKPMRNLQKAIDKAKEVLSEQDLNAVNELIKQFLPFELEHAELVATIYAGWNNLLLSGKNPTDEEIIYESRENWSKRKLTINRQRFFDALKWMKDRSYIPEGKGLPVLKSEEVKTGKNKKSKKVSN